MPLGMTDCLASHFNGWFNGYFVVPKNAIRHERYQEFRIEKLDHALEPRSNDEKQRHW